MPKYSTTSTERNVSLSFLSKLAFWIFGISWELRKKLRIDHHQAPCLEPLHRIPLIRQFTISFLPHSRAFTMKPISCVSAAVILSCSITDCDAFVKSSLLCHNVGRGTMVGYKEATTARSFREEKPDHFLLDEFKTYDGQVVNPYQTLRVGREADRSEVRKAYIKLSRRYHPDGFRQKDILPGRW